MNAYANKLVKQGVKNPKKVPIFTIIHAIWANLKYNYCDYIWMVISLYTTQCD